MMKDLFNEDYLVRSSSYAEVMNGTVLPWLREREKVSFVPGYEGRPLYCVSYEAEDPAAVVLLVHGFTENAYKYAELIWSLLHLRFSVVAYDQRGHGRSWRDEGVPDPSVTHVDHFAEYVRDLEMIAAKYRAESPLPFFVFAHSMGGAVASLFLEQHQDVFEAAVLSSPMIAPQTGGLPAPVISVFCGAARLIGHRKRNPFFMKRYAGPEDFDTSCATDPARFAWYDAVKASDILFRNSVPSWQWTYEASRVTAEILAPGAPEKIVCPVLLCSADADYSVQSEPQQAFIERVPCGKRIFVKGSRHEIFRSVNDVLFPWWHEVIRFYSAHLSDSSRKGGPAQ